MHVPATSQIERLIAEAHGPYVSIYMPTHRRGAETLQDPIRMKNLTREADQQLRSMGCASNDVDRVMRPLVDLIGDYEFWQHQMDGLVVFRSKELFEVYRVDMSVPELAVVGARPHLKPMLALFRSDVRFFVLALSQDEVRVFEGNREGLAEVELEGMPWSMEETWQNQREVPDLQSHSAWSSKAGAHSMVFHGQGSGDEVTKERMQVYFHKIDQVLHKAIPAPRTPLILATVDYLSSIYRKVNSHPGLQPKWVSGNPQTLSARDLHALSLPIALECFQASRLRAADRYLELSCTSQASNELTEVLPAALCGRVDTLFAAVGVQIWGGYNAVSGAAQVSGNHDSGNQDLLNLAAIHTYLNGGAVYAVQPAEVPGGKELAAVYRY
jgi:hypothetical protein